MALTVTSLPTGRARLVGINVLYTSVYFIETYDGQRFWFPSGLPVHEVPSIGTEASYITSEGDSVGMDNPFYHVDVKLDINCQVFREQLIFEDGYQPNPELSHMYYVGIQGTTWRAQIPENGTWSALQYGTFYTRTYTKNGMRETRTWSGGSSWLEYKLKLHDDFTVTVIFDDSWGAHRESVRDSSDYSYGQWGEIPYIASVITQSAVTKLVDKLMDFGRLELPTCLDSQARWRASLSAADGIKAYDLNMVEAFLGFGLDDIIPKKLSIKSIGLLENLCKSKNPITWMLRLTQVAGAMYLHDKYVIGNNVADLAEITGLDPDISSYILDAAQGAKTDGVEAEEINQQLYTVARKISFGEDYFSSTYGGYTSRQSIPYGHVSCKTNARLRARPGVYADVSALSILTDEFGLRFTASRGVEAIPWEFVANWFLPIEDLVHSIEYNDGHLNALYNVESLVISDNVVLELGNSFNELHEIPFADITGRVRYYNRTCEVEFPPTVLSFQNNRGGISSSRILQGGSLLITH